MFPYQTYSIDETCGSLQANWQIRMSGSRGVPYFYNADTKEAVWEIPQGFTAESIKSFPGYQEHMGGGASGKPQQVRASHLLVKHAGSRRPSSWKEVRPATALP
jgi:NIMA-interacting peptidyl-prolyl cis-trans isomerase 1